MAQIHRVKAARKIVGACEKCFRSIGKGAPYKWIGVKPPGSQPGVRRIRCEDCEEWHEWDWNPSLASQCARVAHDTEHQLRNTKSYDTEVGAERIMADSGEEIRIFANTRQVSAERTRYVFGQNNFKTKQFEQDAKNLHRWASQFKKWTCPPLPEPEPTACVRCTLKGMDVQFGGAFDCYECGGEGIYTPDTPSEEQLEEWRQEVAESALEVLVQCPL